MPTAPGRAQRDRVLWFGLAAIVLGGGALRVVHLGAHLPALVAPDEPTVVDRAVLILHGDLPKEYDWPTGAMVLLAGVFKVLGHAGSYLLARGVFVAIALAVIALTGAAAAAIADDGPNPVRRLTAWTAAALVAVAYVSVRLSRQVQPDHLQLLFVLAAFLAIARYDRGRARPWLAAAGALAGLAAATKYLGGIVLVPAAIAVLSGRATATRRRALDLVVLGATAIAGAVAGAPGVLLDPTQVMDGLSFQTGHQAGGHLGYDGTGNGWWFHLTTSLPGSWGWLATAAALGGLIWVLARGSRLQRLAAAYAVPAFLIACGSRVRFPHYVLPALPFLAAFAAIGAVRAGRALHRTPVWLGAAVLAVSLVPTVLDDVRLVRAAGADDTRLIATDEVARLLPPRTPLWSEVYGLLPAAGPRLVPDVATHPELLACECVLAVSSYQEDRYRREPRRYAGQVAVYDELRRRATVLARFPARPRLAYDWDLLPQWGLDRLPLTGELGPVGPVVTLFDLRRLPP